MKKEKNNEKSVPSNSLSMYLKWDNKKELEELLGEFKSKWEELYTLAGKIQETVPSFSLCESDTGQEPA